MIPRGAEATDLEYEALVSRTASVWTFPLQAAHVWITDPIE
jgi:hypothetical protein